MGTRPTLTAQQSDRAAGVLLAQACGDALGAPTEFQPTPLPIDVPVGMTGGGAFDWEPGEWTDDTQMSIAILEAAEAAHASGGELLNQLDLIATSWMSWERTAKDAGTQTRTVLRSRRKTAAELTAVAAELHRENGLTAGNGSLMRTAPVALALLGDPHATAKAARAVSAITHYDPDAGDACVLWCAAIQHAILDGEFDVAAGLHLLSLERRNSWELRIIEAQENDPTAFRWNGWVVHAFQAAWSLIHRTAAHDPSEHVRGVLEGAARLAGDTDTVGAIAGALVGARWGASAVPAQWREVLHGWPGLTGHDLARRGAALGELGSRCSLVGTLR